MGTEIVKGDGYMLADLSAASDADIDETFKVFQEAHNQQYQDVLKPGERVRCELPEKAGKYRGRVMPARRAVRTLKDEGIQARSVASRNQAGYRAIIQSG